MIQGLPGRRTVVAACLAVFAAAGTASLAGDQPAPDAATTITDLLPPRTDSPADWHATVEPLHRCGEPRLLPTCVPPAPCHPSEPPCPYDLVGVHGAPTRGPIYGGPCCPRTGTHDGGPLPRLHRVHDRMVDWFYSPRTPLHP